MDVSKYLNHVRREVGFWCKSRPWAKPFKEDLYSEACLAACEVAKRFDPSRGVAFWTFARQRVIGAMGDYIRREAKHFATEHLTAYGLPGSDRIASNEDHESHIHDGSLRKVPAGLTTSDEATQLSIDADELIRKLPSADGDVIREVIVDGRTQVEAAARLGIGRHKVQEALGRSYRILKKYME